MDGLVTAFEITRGSNGIWTELLWRLAIGIGALASGCLGLIRAARRHDSWRNFVWPLAIAAWGGGWIVLHDFPRAFGHIDDLVDAYREQRYAIAEGDVKVLHVQPASGHSKGDIIRIGDVELVVDYYYATPAYRQTIAHGGVLKENAHARVYHYNGEILRVDVLGR